MRTTDVTDDLEYCEDGSYRGWRATSGPAKGLTLQLTKTGKVKVTTSGPLADRFLPAGNAPLDVNFTVTIEENREGDLDIRWEEPSIQFSFGDRSNPIPDNTRETVIDTVEQFVATVASTTHFTAARGEILAQVAHRQRNLLSARMATIAGEVSVLADDVKRGRDVSGHVGQDLVDSLTAIFTDLAAAGIAE